MRHLLMLTLAASALEAAAIKGVVVDNLTGRPLARAVVALEAIQGSRMSQSQTKTGRNGEFSFPSLGAGLYLVSAHREGFARLRYGQKSVDGAGAPVALEADGAQVLNLRLRRLGAITGTVLDENDVGFAYVEVMAYRDTRPPALAGKTMADERGVFRLGGLRPGRYLVRSGAKRLDEAESLLPTFARETQRVDEAASVEVRLEEQAADVDLHPIFGRLVRLEGRVHNRPSDSVPLLLVSDTGRIQTTDDGSGFRFDNLPPGNYELFAGQVEMQAPTESGRWADFPRAAYDRITLGHDVERWAVMMNSLSPVPLVVVDRDGGRVDPDAVQVYLRRKDLAGEGPARQVTSRNVILPPGRWEALVVTSQGFYPVSVAEARADGWTEFTVFGQRPELRVVLSSRPALVHGKVTASLGQPAAGAPVYLERLDRDTQGRLGELRRGLTDAQGGYRFQSLAPGTYRLVSSFDFDDPDGRTMESARPRTVVVREGEDITVELDLYAAP